MSKVHLRVLLKNDFAGSGKRSFAYLVVNESHPHPDADRNRKSTGMLSGL